MPDFTRSRGCGAPLSTAAAITADYPSEGASQRCGSSSLALSCSCRTVQTGNAQSACSSNPSNRDGCTCCKASMREALKLLCSNRISDLLDFDGFAFVTDDLVVGAEPGSMSPTDRDNLSELGGTFRRFSPCNCDMIDISGTAYGPFGTLVDVDQITLCSLAAIAFQVTGAADGAGANGNPVNPAAAITVCECGPTPTTPEGRYLRVRELLQCQLSGMDRDCGDCVCHCDCTDDCCCTKGVLAALSSLSLNKRATLVAGLLGLRNVTVIGTVGNVLVLGNETDYTFYFVCANKVEALA